MKKAIALPLVAVALVGMLAFAAFVQLTPATGQSVSEPAGTYPADHIIRITALLEFDGKPVVIDELVTCLAEGAGGSTSGRQFLSFRPNRILVAVDTPDGGMIRFSVFRSLCYAYGKTWGETETERTIPDGWTPVLTWFDDRNPQEWVEGIIYISETALNAENGRLRIIEDFALTIPEHPFTESLLTEAEAQAVERDYWQGVPPTGSDVFWQSSGRLGTMIEVPESMWRNPATHYLRTSIHANRDTDPQPLIDFLDGLGEGDRIIAIPYYLDPDVGRDSGDMMTEEALRMLDSFNYGRHPAMFDYLERGVPKTDAERFGLLISENSTLRYQNIPLDLNRFDTRIPWTCEDNVATPDFDNPGLIYIFTRSQRCTHPNNFERLDWPGYGEIPEWYPDYGNVFFDQKTKTVWYYRTN